MTHYIQYQGNILHFTDDDATTRTQRDRTIELVKMKRAGFINQFIPDLFAPVNRERLAQEIEILKKSGRQHIRKRHCCSPRRHENT